MFGRPDGEGRDTIDVSLNKLAQIVLLARAFDAQTSESDPDEASNASDDRLVSVLEAQADNPIGQELREAIEVGIEELALKRRRDTLGSKRFGVRFITTDQQTGAAFF